jgi:hypothetical protein
LHPWLFTLRSNIPKNRFANLEGEKLVRELSLRERESTSLMNKSEFKVYTAILIALPMNNMSKKYQRTYTLNYALHAIVFVHIL